MGSNGDLNKHLPTIIYERERLLAANRLPGPAVVEEKACTTVILPGYVGVVDDYGNIGIEKNRSGG